MKNANKNESRIASSVAALFLSLAIAGGGCAEAPSACDELQDLLQRCYPELVRAQECSAEMLETYAAIDPASADCADLAEAGKADLWGNDGHLNWPHGGSASPSEADWDIVGVVDRFQSAIPIDAIEESAAWTHAKLLDGARSVVWEQWADDERGLGARKMVVEYTQGIVPLPLDVFVDRIPVHEWGLHLDHYVAGEVSDPYEVDAAGRPIRQIERMVLNQVPYDADALNLPAINGDMTKVEVIAYEDGRATVDWRVMYSANGTTESDIGSVSFERVFYGDEEHTLITFHSAHRLAFFGMPVPNALLRAPVVGLGAFFEDHIDHYREVAMALDARGW